MLVGIITSVHPNNGLVSGGINVTIIGSNLGFNSDITEVLLVGQAATILSKTDDQIIVQTASLENPSGGLGDVTVISAALGSTTSVNAFQYHAGM